MLYLPFHWFMYILSYLQIIKATHLHVVPFPKYTITCAVCFEEIDTLLSELQWANVSELVSIILNCNSYLKLFLMTKGCLLENGIHFAKEFLQTNFNIKANWRSKYFLKWRYIYKIIQCVYILINFWNAEFVQMLFTISIN